MRAVDEPAAIAKLMISRGAGGFEIEIRRAHASVEMFCSALVCLIVGLLETEYKFVCLQWKGDECGCVLFACCDGSVCFRLGVSCVASLPRVGWCHRGARVEYKCPCAVTLADAAASRIYVSAENA